MLLVFHGNARDADRYRDDARALADKNCLLVVAPLLDRRTFPLWRYQHGGVVRDGVVQDPRDWTGRLVPAIAAPYGLGKVYSGADGEAQLRRYLEQPITIYLGQGDVRADDRDPSPEAQAEGASRYQRGRNAFNVAKALAQARGWPFNWRLVELPGVGHNARKMFAAPQASEALAP